MEFNSLIFILIYLPIFIGSLYFIKENKIRNILLILFSLLFYFFKDKNHLIILLSIVLISYLFGLIVKKNKLYYALYLLIVLGILSYFKYANYLLSSFKQYFNNLDALTIIMPLGISFITFTSISYVSDIYYGKYEKETNIFNLLAFLTFFPTVVSGPLIRYDSFKNYLDNKDINVDGIAKGLRRFIIGLGKKVIIANQIGIITSTLFKDNMTISFLISIIALVSYAVQLYYDFSGYSDMAIGIGEMIGYKIPENFNDPYFSKSIGEFWRRWHISLNKWFIDYLYIPLGGSKKGFIRKLINTMIVFLLSGLWHGSTINFLIWGFIHGLFVCLELVLKDKYNSLIDKLKINKESIIYKTIQIIYVNIIVLFAYIFFRSDNLIQVKNLIDGLLFKGSLANIVYIKQLAILHLLLFVLIGIILMLPVVKKGLNILKNKLPILNDICLLIILFISIVFIISGSYNAFIYFNF